MIWSHFKSCRASNSFCQIYYESPNGKVI